MAAHRYWALGLSARPGSGNGVSVAEVEMRASPGGADLCVGGTAGGTFTTGVAANAFDDNTSTYCYHGATGGLHVRLSYDFGSPVSVVELWLRVPGAGTHNGTTYGPAHCRVEWSDDGAAWRIGSVAFDAGGLVNDGAMTVGGISDVPPGGVELAPMGRLITFPPTWPGSVRPLALQLLRRVDYGGLGRIAGTVSIKGAPNVPVRRRVRLIREVDGLCVAEQWSDPATGAYDFTGFDPAITYTVLAYDGPRVFRAVLADAVLPTPWP